MATTERDILEGKVLPELQAIASSMGVQGYQRLRKADLIGAIIAKAQGVEFVPSSAPSRGRRGGTTTKTTTEAQAPAEGSGNPTTARPAAGRFLAPRWGRGRWPGPRGPGTAPSRPPPGPRRPR